MNNLFNLLNKTLSTKQTISIISFVGAFVFLSVFSFSDGSSFIKNLNLFATSRSTENSLIDASNKNSNLATLSNSCVVPLELAWNPSPEQNITSYILSYGLTSGVYDFHEVIGDTDNDGEPETRFTLRLTGYYGQATTYYLVLQSVNDLGQTSANSAELSFTINCPDSSGSATLLPVDLTDNDRVPNVINPRYRDTQLPSDDNSPLSQNIVYSGKCPPPTKLKVLVRYNLLDPWRIFDNLEPSGYNVNTGVTYYTLDDVARALGYPPRLFMRVACIKDLAQSNSGLKNVNMGALSSDINKVYSRATLASTGLPETILNINIPDEDLDPYLYPGTTFGGNQPGHAIKFTLTEQTRIEEIKVLLRAGFRENHKFTAVIYGQNAQGLPDKIDEVFSYSNIYSTPYNNTIGWEPIEFTNLVLPAGEYWLAFETRTGDYFGKFQSNPPSGGGNIVHLSNSAYTGSMINGFVGNEYTLKSSYPAVYMTGTRITTDPVETPVTLTINQPTTGGEITSSTSTSSFIAELNSPVVLTASTSAGYTFAGWTGDCASFGTSTACAFTMNDNKTVSATFAPVVVTYPDEVSSIEIVGTLPGNKVIIGQTYPIVIDYDANDQKDVIIELKKGNDDPYKKVRTEIGTGENQVATINFEIPSDQNVSTTEDLTLIAYLIPRSTGPDSGPAWWNANTASLILGNIDADLPVGQTPVTLTINQPTIGGRIDASTTTRTFIAELNTPVKLTATTTEAGPGYSIDPEYRFSNWTGACDTEPSDECILTMDDNKTVSAVFEEVGSGYEEYIYSIEVNGMNDDDEIQIGQTYPITVDYDANEEMDIVVELKRESGSTSYMKIRQELAVGEMETATINFTIPNTVSTTQDLAFRAYIIPRDTGADTGNVWENAIIVEDVIENISAIPAFTQTPVTLTVTQPTIGGRIDASTSTRSFFAEDETEVELTAVPATGYEFSGWTDDCLFENSTNCMFNMTEDKTVSAEFELIQTVVNLTINPRSGGTITPSTNATSFIAENNTTITFTASTTAGYRFAGWLNDCSNFGTSTMCSLVMDDNKRVSANFVPDRNDDVDDDDDDGKVNRVDLCPGTPSGTPRGKINNIGCIKPKFKSRFDIVKNLDNENLNNVVDFEIGKSDSAKIKFTTPLNLNNNTEMDFESDSNIIIEGKRVFVNSNALTALRNATATVTFFNVTKNQEVYKDGVKMPNITGIYSPSPENTFSFTVSGFSTYTIVDVPDLVTATTTYSLTTTKEGSGTVYLNGVEVSSGVFAKDSTVTVTAKAATGYKFSKWTGACTGSSTCTVVMTGVKTVNAVFVKESSNGSSNNKPKAGSYHAVCTLSKTKVGFGSTVSINIDVKNSSSSYTTKWSGSTSGLIGFDASKEDQLITVPNKIGKYTLSFEAKDTKGKKAKVECETIEVDSKYSKVTAQSVSAPQTNNSSINNLGSIIAVLNTLRTQNKITQQQFILILIAILK